MIVSPRWWSRTATTTMIVRHIPDDDDNRDDAIDRDWGEEGLSALYDKKLGISDLVSFTPLSDIEDLCREMNDDMEESRRRREEAGRLNAQEGLRNAHDADLGDGGMGEVAYPDRRRRGEEEEGRDDDDDGGGGGGGGDGRLSPLGSVDDAKRRRRRT
ncbi:hypothetical protein ACHAW5_008771 [Stephanodiscus triporus]|uniref:Uncharacterized protein n=1 Tax=Stephanodiscus triporus TaxID=2934178 RepID=A0ABD3P6X5_9STRA